MKPVLIQNWNRTDIQRPLSLFMLVKSEQLEKALKFIGIEIVNEARTKTIINSTNKVYPHEKTGYYDITANLRSSIGFVLLKNKKQVAKDFKGNADGKSKGLKSAIEVANQFNGLVLCVVAGMHYAVYVESKGYNVISSSLPLKATVEKKLKRLTGAK